MENSSSNWPNLPGAGHQTGLICWGHVTRAGAEADHALTFKLDRSLGANQNAAMKHINNLVYQKKLFGILDAVL